MWCFIPKEECLFSFNSSLSINCRAFLNCHIISSMMLKIISALFFIFLVLFPFGQLTKIPLAFLNSPDVHLYLIDIVLFLLVLGWGIWRFLIEKKKYQLPPLAKPIFLFTALGGLSLAVNSPLFSGREVGVGFLYLLRWIFYAGLYFVLFDLKERWIWLKKNLLCFLTIIGSMVGILALVQYFLWPNLKALEVLHYDPHFYRVVGTFLDPGFTGIILVLTLILLVNNGSCLTFSPVRHPRFAAGARREFLYVSHPFNLLLIIVVYVTLALTYSRASWLAFLVGIMIIILMKKAWKILPVLLVLVVATFYLLPRPAGEGGKIERTYTIEARLTNYRQALIIAKDHPFFGVGFNTYRYAQRNYGFIEKDWQVSHAGAGVDNSWLFVLATTGILGFVSYLWLYWKALGRFKNILVVSSLTAVFIHSFFLNSLFYPWVMAWLWLLLATESS